MLDGADEVRCADRRAVGSGACRGRDRCDRRRRRRCVRRRALWPAHEWDAQEKPLPLSGLYVGAAGVIWALDELRRRGHADSSRDLAAAVVRAVELEQATPDFFADEHYRRGALISGETGALLVAFRLTSSPTLANDVHALVRGNVDNPTDDISWGAPGTLLAALAMGMDRRAAMAGSGPRDGDGATCPPWRGRAVAAGRRLPRPRDAARRRGKHARPAPRRARRRRFD